MLAAVISITAITLGLFVPSLLGEITNILYSFWLGDNAQSIGLVPRMCLILVLLLIGSMLCELATMVLMNNVVSRHFTCNLRIAVSEKIKKLPVRYVDNTPNGEVISRMTDDVSMMGTTVHTFVNTVTNGFLKLLFISIVIG